MTPELDTVFAASGIMCSSHLFIDHPYRLPQANPRNNWPKMAVVRLLALRALKMQSMAASGRSVHGGEGLIPSSSPSSNY